MKLQKHKTLFRGLAATTATLLTLSTVAYGIAKSPLAIGWVDGFFGINSREIWEDQQVTINPTPSEDGEQISVANYEKQYDTVEEYYAALVEHNKKQGEEGFVVMKNDNDALPLANNGKVVLFGWNCYNIPTRHTGVTGGGSAADRITLYSALNEMEGITVNDTVVAGDFTGAMTSAPRYADYTIPEVFEAKSNWVIDSNSTAIVAVGRGGGENNNYKPDAATNAEDPLALSDEELEMIDYAKSHCAKVVVLVVSANAMELGPIAKGGAHEVDAIGFCGIPNAHQYGGIANVLAGKANATGAMPDTYVYDNSFNPATINMGGQQYTDYTSIDVGETPDELGRTNLQASSASSSGLYAENYIVDAEGIYVGYKYYETRYYDAMVDPAGTNATNTIGSTKAGQAWDYANEVIYTFGHGLSYIPYTQQVKEVQIGVSENGNVKATVTVTNNGTEDGYFLAQLYVNRPYTQYDKTNKIEKSAVDFLNSGKVHVKAGESEDIEITIPTRYLASWDSNGAETYVLDAGDYYFTAAAGAHEAVNNILTAQGHETDGTTNGTGTATRWNLAELDDETFATSNGYAVTNQADDIDINYYLPDKVTYLTRSNWTTYPKNYTNYTNGSGIEPEAAFTIADSPKAEEWIRQLRNIQYIPQTDGTVTNVEGILPAEVQDGTYESVWEWIMSYATRDPAAFLDINSEQWQAVAQAINLNVAVANILYGGSQTDSWYGIGNPTSRQSESVAGYSQNLSVDGTNRNLAVASNTLLGSSFNPELAYEWGLLEGEGGLWLQTQNNAGAMTVWGAGLNQHRHAYNGRNSEYMSEDPMLSNRMGEAQMRGAVSMGAINGPKHMGFNDQEYNRVGSAAYMTEQKMRETDIRCYEGALRADEGKGTGVMMSFCRIGPVSATNHAGLIKHIMREEWGFTGIVTTDMGRINYHEGYGLVMATVNQYALFRKPAASFMGSAGNDFGDDVAASSRPYITMGALKKDPVLAEQARQTSLYELYTIAHSGTGGFKVTKSDSGNEGPITVTRRVLTGTIEFASWEGIFVALEVIFGVGTAVAGLAWIASNVMPGKKEEN